jgi:Flp pilus assembly protein TadG
MKNTSRIPVASRRRRTSKGTAMLESSLIFIVFASLFIGAFDFGQFLLIHSSLVERARTALRWGAINGPTNTTAIRNMVLYNQSATPPAGTATYYGLTSGNLDISTSGSGTDNYLLTMRISGYSYNMLSLRIAGGYTGPAITVTVPLGLYD